MSNLTLLQRIEEVGGEQRDAPTGDQIPCASKRVCSSLQ